ncbi:MAG: band 7 protein [Planctomycetes bacterium]|nr:band 7 protein [Planctomycetota bacterium]
MAAITHFGFVRHLRSEPNAHVVRCRAGKTVQSGRGLSFWFLPLSSTALEVPCDDLDQAFLFHARSADFQDVTAQGTVTYRVREPERLAERIDFSLDLASGAHQKKPLEQLAALFTQRAQELAWSYLAHTDVRSILAQGVEAVRERIASGLQADESLRAMGLEVVSVRVSGIAPSAELEKALQAPVREKIQQASDEATFQRRAQAVEKERAIQENELANKIELARREEQLIAQKGQNERRRVGEEAEASRMSTESKVANERLEANGEADGIRQIEEARVNAESARMAIYRDMPSGVLLALGVQSLAGKLQKIEHLNLSPDLLGPMLARVLDAGAARLEAPAKKA